MKLIEPNVEIWKQESGIEGMYKHIERCARVCYKSENKGNVTSEQFVKGLIQRKHMRPLEFGTLCFSLGTFPDWKEKTESPWFKECDGWLITNLRWLIEHAPFNWEMYIMNSERQGGLEADLVNKYRPTLHWNISRGIADEFRTHVTLTSLMESTRYCNYSKDKFGGEITFVNPYWHTKKDNFDDVLKETENYYLIAIKGGLKPQEAREMLPLCVATNLVQCGFNDSWDNFFNQRCDKAAHPDAQLIANKAKELLKF